MCENCDIKGREKKAGSGYSLDDCKLACQIDPDCQGIDFGKGGRRGQCWLNYDHPLDMGTKDEYGLYIHLEDVVTENGDFDSYIKNPEICGTSYFHP